MNKARRHELKMLHYKRRLKKHCLKGKEGKFYAFRSHGKPCSCSFCADKKYRSKDRQRIKREALTMYDNPEIIEE